MLTRTKVFGLTIAALLVLTLVPGAPTGYAVGEPVEPQGRPTTAAPPSVNPAHPLAPNADAENVELVGHIGSAIRAVDIQGNYAYTSEGYSLIILDVSDSASPTLVGRTPPLPDVVQVQQDYYGTEDVTVDGAYAYVANRWHGIWVVDVSDPANPAKAGIYDAPGYSVAVIEDYAYIAGGWDGLRAVDISDPANPTEVGFHDTPGQAKGIAVAGGYAYLADGEDGGLRVLDISNPTNPTEVGFCDTLGNAVDVVIAGTYAYVADYDFGLRVVDISDPANPTEVGWHYTIMYPRSVAVSENYAYLVGQNLLQVFDVSSRWPREVSCGPGGGSDVVVAGSYAYSAGYHRLEVVNVSDPTNPTEVGIYATLGNAYDLAIAGDYAYVTGGVSGGMWVVDISDTARPVAMGFYSTPRYEDARAVAVAGDYAYVTAEDEGMRVVDISDPTNPTEVGFFKKDWSWAVGAGGVAVSDQYAYVAHGYGLSVVDISDPTNPTEIGLCDTNSSRSVAVAGGYAYVAGANGLDIVDISDPTHPTRVAHYSCSPPGDTNVPGAEDVAVVGDYAYVTDSYWPSGLWVVDVSDPTNPTQAGFYQMGETYGVAVSGNYAYIGAEDEGLRVLDVSDPANPTEVGFYDFDTSADATGVVVAGDYVYVANYPWASTKHEAGLFILCFVPPPEVSILAPSTGNVFRHGDSLLVKADVTVGGEPLIDGDVMGSIPLNGSFSMSFDLYDDGSHEDGAANDGVYAARITLYDPLTMPAGNYTITVTATSESGSGSDSTSINVTSGGGAPTVALEVSGPSAPDFFAGEQAAFVATLTYPDSSIHTNTAVTVTVTAPNLNVTHLELTNVATDTWQGSYIFPVGQGGTYYLNARADPPSTTHFVDGFGGAQVYVYVDELEITVNPPPGTAFLYGTVPLSVCVTAGGAPVSGVTVDAEINLPVIEDGGTLIEVDGSGCYERSYVPTYSGTHNVTYTAERPQYLGTVRDGSFEVSTQSSSLEDWVWRFGNDAVSYSETSQTLVGGAASDGDYFARKLRIDRTNQAINVLVDFASIAKIGSSLREEPLDEAVRGHQRLGRVLRRG